MNPTLHQQVVVDRIRTMLLEEMVADMPLRWYYISTASSRGFEGGYYLKVRGPIEAWTLLHRLWKIGDVETETWGPLDDAAAVPEKLQWRKLTKEEVEAPL